MPRSKNNGMVVGSSSGPRGAGCEGRGTQALRIRILRPLRVRFIVEELSATEMRSYSKTDYNKLRFMSVIKSCSGTRGNWWFGSFTLPFYYVIFSGPIPSERTAVFRYFMIGCRSNFRQNKRIGWCHNKITERGEREASGRRALRGWRIPRNSVDGQPVHKRIIDKPSAPDFQ